MKAKSIIFCLSALLISINTIAQWTEINVTPNHAANSYDFIDDNIGYASLFNISTNGIELAKTVDGGNSWAVLNAPMNTYDYMDMAAPADSIIYVACRDLNTAAPNMSKIYKTIDNGLTWTDLTPDTTNTGQGFAAVHFVDELVGYWVISEKLYKTIDGGANWTSSTLPLGHNALSINSIHFNDENNGVIGTWNGTFAYLGGVLSTTDGGITWSDTAFSINSSSVSSVKQTSAMVAYAGTAGWGSNLSLLFKTTNNGVTWSEVSIPDTLSNSIFRCFDFTDDEHGFIVEESMDKSYLYETTNGGVSWSLFQVIDTSYLFEIHLTSNTGYLTGNLNQFYKLQNPTSMNEVEKDYSFNIYPNPSTDQITIEINSRLQEPRKLKIINLLGEEVYNQPIPMIQDTYQRQLDVSSYTKGIYFLMLNTSELVFTKKIIIQ